MTDFSFLRNWFGASADSTSLEVDSVEQSSSPLIGCDVEENDEFGTSEDWEFINPCDPNEIHSLPDQAGESVVKIAGFNKEKLLEMSNFCKISYGDNDEKLGERKFRALASGGDVYLNGDEDSFENLENEKMYKTRAELIEEGYSIIPFYCSNGRCIGFVFAKDREITIAYRGTQGFDDMLVDANVLFTIQTELLPKGGRIHSGFCSAFIDSWPSLYKVLKPHAEEQGLEIKDFKINLTGHSMGGALAKIAALCLNQIEEAEDLHVATFGDPRVFDLTASEFYNEVLQEKTIRVTQHRQDPVPAVAPGCLGYAHVGAQLRVSVPGGYSTHKVDSYHEAIYVTGKRDFQSNDSVSLFYYPSGILSRINCAILGNAQYYAANLLEYAFGPSNSCEEVKSKYQNTSQAKQVEDNHENISQIEQIKVESCNKDLLSAVMGS